MSVLLKRDLWVFDGRRGFGDLLDALRRSTRARPSSAEVVATAIAFNGGERRGATGCGAQRSFQPHQSARGLPRTGLGARSGRWGIRSKFLLAPALFADRVPLNT